MTKVTEYLTGFEDRRAAALSWLDNFHYQGWYFAPLWESMGKLVPAITFHDILFIWQDPEDSDRYNLSIKTGRSHACLFSGSSPLEVYRKYAYGPDTENLIQTTSTSTH